MITNLNERDRCVVNRDEDLTTVDFDGDVNLVEKEAVVLTLQKGGARKDSMKSVAMQRRRGTGGVALTVSQESSASGKGDWELEGASARGRSGWSEIRPDNRKHRLLCLRSQCQSRLMQSRRPRLRLKKRVATVVEEERRELSFGSTVARSRVRETGATTAWHGWLSLGDQDFGAQQAHLTGGDGKQVEGSGGRSDCGSRRALLGGEGVERWGAPPLLLEHCDRRREVATRREG
ncbi:hypothetical protein BHM03_00062337 [Ensete ventricosum]|nr:hypothetical protein BHM03_00062337 [Ensete ventricosum]